MNRAPRILFLAPTFAPAGGTGSLRLVKMIKSLDRCGWEPVVLTRKRDPLKYRDDTLLEELPLQLSVFPVEWSEYHPVNSVRCLLKARKINQEISLDGILTTSPDEVHHLHGWFTSKFLSLPWIADLRDPIEGSWPGLKRQLIRGADLCTTAWPVKSLVSESVHQNVKTRWIPNGFDPDDFTECNNNKNEVRRFVHTGSLYRPRQDPMPVIEAIRRVRDNHPNLLNHNQFCFSGAILSQQLRNEVDDFLQRHRLDKIITIEPFRSHREAVELIQAADVGIAFKSEPALPYKFCEYLGGKLHLLFYYPKDEPVTGLMDGQAGITHVEHGNVGKLAEQIEALLTCETISRPDSSFRDAYSWETIGKKFDQILRETLL